MIEEIFSGFLDQTTIQDIKENPKAYETTSIKFLGIDSLSTMELVLRLEEILNVEFDYDSFNMDDIKTVGSILDLVCRTQGEHK